MSTDVRATLVYISPLVALVTLLVVGAYVIAFDTLLLYLTFAVGAAFLVIFLRGRPWRPAVFLLAVVPFQGVLIRNFGLAGHGVTLLAVVAFLLSSSPRSWANRLLGTTTQKLTGLFVVAMGFSFVVAGFDLPTLLRYGQIVVLFFTVAILVQGFGGGAHIHKLAWAVSGSAALLFILSILDFYLGLRVLPVEGSRSFEAGLLEEIQRGLDTGIHSYRLAGPAQTYGANRFAFYGLLPISLLVGLLLTERHGGRGGLAGACLLAIGFGILASGSLSGMMGASAALVLALLASTKRAMRSVLLLAVVAVALLQFTRVVPEVVVSDRFGAPALPSALEGKVARWSFGFELFSESPIYGIGLSRFDDEAASRGRFGVLPSVPYRGGADPHSAFVQLLSETGVLGTVPFLLLLTYVVWVLVRRRPRTTRELRLWTWIMASALVGMLIMVNFHTYQYVRFFWVPIAFAAMLETLRAARTPLRDALNHACPVSPA